MFYVIQILDGLTMQMKGPMVWEEALSLLCDIAKEQNNDKDLTENEKETLSLDGYYKDSLGYSVCICQTE